MRPIHIKKLLSVTSPKNNPSEYFTDPKFAAHQGRAQWRGVPPETLEMFFRKYYNAKNT